MGFALPGRPARTARGIPSLLVSAGRGSPGRARRGLFGGGGQLRATAVHYVLRRCDRLDDVVVAGAAAEIALETLTDFLLRQAVRMLLHQVDGRHDHARRAEAALQ